MDVDRRGVRAVSSSTAPSPASSPATKPTKSVAWSYEPSPPRRRATAANGQPPSTSSSDGLRAIEARVEQLSQMTRLMRVLPDGGA